MKFFENLSGAKHCIRVLVLISLECHATPQANGGVIVLHGCNIHWSVLYDRAAFFEDRTAGEGIENRKRKRRSMSFFSHSWCIWGRGART